MIDDFSDHPKSIGELRSERDDNMSAWSARDVLISVLRDIDSGVITGVETLVVSFRCDGDGDDGAKKTSHAKSAPDIHQAISVLELTKFDICARTMGLVE